MGGHFHWHTATPQLACSRFRDLETRYIYVQPIAYCSRPYGAPFISKLPHVDIDNFMAMHIERYIFIDIDIDVDIREISPFDTWPFDTNLLIRTQSAGAQNGRRPALQGTFQKSKAVSRLFDWWSRSNIEFATDRKSFQNAFFLSLCSSVV